MPSNPLVHTWSRREKWWCKGHGTVFEAANGQWYILYHAYEKGYLNHGRKTLLQEVAWTDDDWPYIPLAAEEPQPLPVGEASKADAFCDDFAGGIVKPYWSFWEHYAPSRIAEAPGGGLLLTGKGDTIGTSSPMTFPCGFKSYTLEVKLAIEGNAQGGLTLFYDGGHYCGIGLSSRGIQLHKYGKAYLLVPAVQRQMTLRILNADNDVSYAYRTEDGDWRLIDFGCEVSGVNHNALDGYNSLRPGIFALGDGAVRFQNFRLTELDE